MSGFPNDWIQDLVKAFWLIKHGLQKARGAVSDKPSSAVYDDLVGDSPFIIRTIGLSKLSSSRTGDLRGERTWNRLLPDFHSSECFEPKDIYYALASMTIPKIRVDYSL
jgi:hypothetical protein